MSAFPVRMCRYNRFLPLDRRPGIDLGIEAFATLSDGTRIFNPGWYRKAERALKTPAAGLASQEGEQRRRKAVTLLAKAHQKVRASGRTFTTRRRSL